MRFPRNRRGLRGTRPSAADRRRRRTCSPVQPIRPRRRSRRPNRRPRARAPRQPHPHRGKRTLSYYKSVTDFEPAGTRARVSARDTWYPSRTVIGCRPFIHFSTVAFLACTATACGSEDPAPGGNSGAAGAPPNLSHTLAPAAVGPGAELNGICQSWTLNNDTPLYVNKVVATNN